MHRTENLLVRAILLFVLPAACASHHAGSPVRDVAKCTEYPLVQVGQGGGVIFPAGTGNVDGYRAGAITEFWTPTADDVQRAEPRITEYLQANAPAMGWAFVRRRMATELGPDWQAKFRSFGEQAAAAASLGQVHRATLPDGRLVPVPARSLISFRPITS